MPHSISLRALLREDWQTHRRSWSKPGLHALAVQRLGAWRRDRSLPVRLGSGIIYWPLKTLIRNVYGTEIYDTTVIGRRVHIAHHVGIVLGSASVIGDDVTIRQNVTLGAVGPGRPGQHPTIGNRVSLGAGAVVAGPVTVGDGATIGPGAIVLSDVPPGATALAPPARVMKSS